MGACDEFAKRYIDAFNRRDYDTIEDCFAEDATYDDTAWGELWEGRDRIMEIQRGFEHSYCSDYRYELIGTTQEGNRYTIEFEMSGTYSPTDGSVATGEPILHRIAMVGHFDENGRIKANKDYWDSTQTRRLRPERGY